MTVNWFLASYYRKGTYFTLEVGLEVLADTVAGSLRNPLESLRSRREPALQNYGYQVLTAADGAGAVATYAQHIGKIAVVSSCRPYPRLSRACPENNLRPLMNLKKCAFMTKNC